MKIKKFFKKEEEIINPFFEAFGRKRISVEKLLKILEINGYRTTSLWKFVKVQGDITKEVTIRDMKIFLADYIKKNFHSDFDYYITHQICVGNCFVKNLKSL